MKCLSFKFQYDNTLRKPNDKILLQTKSFKFQYDNTLSDKSFVEEIKKKF